MLIDILQHAPTWVWFLLAALVAIGVSQSRPRHVTLFRAALLPFAMVVLAVNGIVTAFPGHPAAVATWFAGVALSLLATRALGSWQGIRWSASERRFIVPGSWLPLALILALFALKFSVGASLAMHPAIAHSSSVADGVGLLYGLFSGAFLGRSMTMILAARRDTESGPIATA